MKRVHLKIGDKLRICGEDYRIIRNLYKLRGFRFRTYLVRRVSDKKDYVAKITQEPGRALNELRAYIYLKTKKYPGRYYAEIVAFDHEAQLIRNGNFLSKFYVMLFKYLPERRFKLLSQYLKNKPSINQRKKLADKLERRVNRLHELRISHGDLREDNIMIEEKVSGRMGVRLIDFDLSKFGDEGHKNKDKKALKRILKKILERTKRVHFSQR
jgi:serine/threonine protein kinase